ncbi:hypothetical protein OEZ85_011847 [Tetradesmus obliquus]|uniref:Uncharacterized protein n=1 Tax=Tetradesmus obliquus TaxID=3088 RepID=A0ABY8TRK0_TETOB|nr:hypothetical protein OEZ85_011847 [Tetradesmus obliquus]
MRAVTPAGMQSWTALAGRRIRTCEDLFWALSIVLVAWLLQQAIEASNSNQAVKTALLAPKSCQVQHSSPTPQECPQQPLQESGEDGSSSSSSSSQGQQEAASAKPAAASTFTVAFIYVDAGCSSERSSDSAADNSFPVEQAQLAEQDDTAADDHCCTSRQQQQHPAAAAAAAAKGKLQVPAADSDTLQQQEACAVQPGSLPVAAAAAAAAAAAVVVVQQQAAVVKLSWLQRTHQAAWQLRRPRQDGGCVGIVWWGLLFLVECGSHTHRIAFANALIAS